MALGVAHVGQAQHHEVELLGLGEASPGLAVGGVQVIEEDTWSVVEQRLKPGQIPCSVCGRLRRGVLNRWCAENGFNKLALGHHLDDAVETFFLNLLYQRRLDPLKPLTPTDAGTVSTIRPLILLEEQAAKDWAARYGLAPIACPTCDPFPNSRRRDLKKLLDEFRLLQPQLTASVRDALYGRQTALPVVQ